MIRGNHIVSRACQDCGKKIICFHVHFAPKMWDLCNYILLFRIINQIFLNIHFIYLELNSLFFIYFSYVKCKHLFLTFLRNFEFFIIKIFWQAPRLNLASKRTKETKKIAMNSNRRPHF